MLLFIIYAREPNVVSSKYVVELRNRAHDSFLRQSSKNVQSNSENIVVSQLESFIL